MEKNEFQYCQQCGTKNEQMAQFCINCGSALQTQSESATTNKTTMTNESTATTTSQPATVTSQQVTTEAQENVDSVSSLTPQHHSGMIDEATHELNNWAGGDGSVHLKLSTFLSEVFRNHTQEEAEEIFIVGTRETTPPLADVVDDKIQPWLFSRVLVLIVFSGFLLQFLALLNANFGTVYSMDAIMAISVPVAALMLFFEMNIYKNISMYQVVQIFSIGGILSIIAAVIIDLLIGNGGSIDFVGAMLTGFAEELGKVIVAAYFVKKLNANNIFNGMLIGAAVGSGFAAFENITYMFGSHGQFAPISYALFRSITSISTHGEWCAIATAGLVVAKGYGSLEFSTFFDRRFLRFFFMVVILHMLWDWNLLNGLGLVRYVILAVCTWVLVFVFINAGLQQVKQRQIEQRREMQTSA
ncbi:PrsW family glutamic-type intramembrane protease [Fructilactobacillus florum]|uniref:DUF7577 domain-containing protein n=1 Tax=Fructilactobacillus florum DSM 22689 = JCM 16035 TaxID=1423745 RepID=A0A0R2CHM2_9LACO|nr:PrsW family intramembrane metalloprotease [Fructilactobacillus florum]KRM91167.1 hypothetical protein FC87_GL001094 [Fructilactobacillus florum DSM 22689 = JCM 16035]